MKNTILLTALVIMSASYAAETNIENIKKEIAKIDKELRQLSKKVHELNQKLRTYDLVIVYNDHSKNTFDVYGLNRSNKWTWTSIDTQGKNLKSVVSAFLNNPELLRKYLGNEKEEITKLIREYQGIIAKEQELDRLYALLSKEFTPFNSPVYIR